MPKVVVATDFLFSCSTETQPRILELIEQHRLPW